MSDDVSMNLVLNFSPVYFENAEVQGEILRALTEIKVPTPVDE